MPDPEAYTKVTEAVENQQFEQAKKKLNPLLKKEPENIGLLLDAGFIYANLELYEDAQGFYQKVLELAPDSPAGYTGLGFVYKIQGNHEKRFEMFQQALEKAPANAMIHFELGETHLDLDQFEAALESFEKAIQFGDPETQAETLQRMAQVHLGLDNPDKCLEICHNVEKKFPELISIHYVIAGAEATKENWVSAETHLQKYLEFDPEDEDALDMLDHIKSEQKSA